MSIFARTPESNAAWDQLKRNVALGPDDAQQRSPPREERRRELRLLFAGTRQKETSPPLPPSLIRANTHPHFATRSPHLTLTD